ncbi:hypothetical protein IH824_08555 [candidate division KSB1 bacterium]|nr:hypothetical protein [candidate division KSB1 bacterium]
MRRLKTIIGAALVFSILSGSFDSVKANGCTDSGNNGIALASLVGFGVLFIYDIVSAPSSAKRYNESIASMFPLIKDRQYGLSNDNLFGEPVFSRAALIKSNRKPIVYTVKQKEKREKSPGVAFLWSLGATAIPPLLGGALTDGTLEGILIVSGITLGPSAGHFYAKRYSRGLLTSALRIGLGALFISTLNFCV